MTAKQRLRQQREDGETNPKLGFGVNSSAARAKSSYSMNPSSTGADSAAQGSRQVSQNNSSGLDWMRATTDEISRSTQQSINTWNSPGFQRMLDNQTARSRSASNYQNQQARDNAIFSNRMQQQNQAAAASQQSQMARQQMGWAQDLALGGQPGDGRRRGSTIISTLPTSQAQTGMAQSSRVVPFEYEYFQQRQQRLLDSALDSVTASRANHAAIFNAQLNFGRDWLMQGRQLELQGRQLALQERGMNMDDRYRNRALAVDAIMRANQRSLWSSPLEQIALSQVRQPRMA